MKRLQQVCSSELTEEGLLEPLGGKLRGGDPELEPGREGDPGLDESGREGDPGLYEPGREGDPGLDEPGREGDPSVAGRFGDPGPDEPDGPGTGEPGRGVYETSAASREESIAKAGIAIALPQLLGRGGLGSNESTSNLSKTSVELGRLVEGKQTRDMLLSLSWAIKKLAART